MFEQTWDFPHQGFHSYCACHRIIMPLSSNPDPGAEKIPHISHNLLQPLPAPTANNTSISGWSRQTAPSAVIWASSQTLSNTSPDKAGKFSTIFPRLISSPLSLDCQEVQKEGWKTWMSPQKDGENLYLSSQRWQHVSYRMFPSPRALIWGWSTGVTFMWQQIHFEWSLHLQWRRNHLGLIPDVKTERQTSQLLKD